jgi:poly-gamma-glutamate synthesis protein (capsule biosynthesis protein)
MIDRSHCMSHISRHPLGALLTLGLSCLPSALSAQELSCPRRDPIDVPVTCTSVDPLEALGWVYNAIVPSEANPLQLKGMPPEADLPTGSPRVPSKEKRIVLFSDLMPAQKDSIPLVHNELRALLASADLVIGNVESPVYRSALREDADQTSNFHVSTNYLRSFLAQYCVDPHKAVLSVANNHANDHGRWPETLESLIAENTPIESRKECALPVRGVVGAKPTRDDHVDVYDIGELRVGVVAFTQVINCPRQGAYRDVESVLQVDWNAVKAARDIDLLIAAPHWDRQFHYFPNAETQVLAELLTEQGFDLIAGSHPSILQPAQRFPDGLAFYSLSSINVNFSAASTNLVFAAELMVDPSGQVTHYKLHPFVQRKRSKPATLPASSICADGRKVTDKARATDNEIVPLRDVSDTWGLRSRLQKTINLVFPPSGS